MSDISVSSSVFMWGAIGIVLVIFALIYILRLIFIKNETGLSEKYANKVWSNPLEARNKYPDVDVFKWSRTFFWVGGISALLLMIMAFNWTQYEKKIVVDLNDLTLEEEIEIEPPRTAEPPPPPPPPPPPVIEEVPEEMIEEDEAPVFEDQTITEETVIDEKPVEIKKDDAPPPPPPPPPPKPKEEEIFKVVEQQPRFPGCESKGSDKDKDQCAKEKLLEFIYKNIKYPAIARENGIQGQCVVRFVVEKDGSIANAEVVKDIGGGCGEESLRVVNLMNDMPQKWTPGKQRGVAVRVQYNLPVKFKLEN